MSESAFWIFNEAFPIGAEMLYAIGLALFVKPFLLKQGRGRNMGIIFGVYLTGRLFCGCIPAFRGVAGLVLIVFLAVVSGLLGLEKRLAFLLMILFWNTRISSGLIVESLSYIVERRHVSLESLEAVYFHTVMMITSFLLSHAALLFVMLYVLKRQLMKRKIPVHRRELCYVSLIPTAGILFGQMISVLLFEFEDGIFLKLYERHPAFLAVVPLLALLFYAGAYVTIMFQQRIAALQEEQAVCFVEQQQAKAIRARVHEMEQMYNRIRKLKHEMRGHLTNMKGMVHNGDYVNLEDYIAQIDGSIGDFGLLFQTGSPVTDVIVNDIRQQCQNLGICFQVDFHYPESGGYDAFDLGIILHNLLQNALEACEKMTDEERFIILTGKRKGRFFLMEVSNSYEGEVVFGQDGLPVTTKQEEVFMHGIGLSNVRQEAEKYMGELEFRTDSQKFFATVLLQERSSL